MENSDVEKPVINDDGSQLSRNRSFKSKQLVRSQAIREATSPPRTVSPSVRTEDARGTQVRDQIDSSREDVFYNDNKCEHGGKQRVEIQITSGSWSSSPEQSWSSRRSRRWGAGRSPPRDLLSNNPRVACVCGSCGACPHCRGRRRRHKCPTKQDSGIVCSEDCQDCSDTEQNGITNDLKKSASGNIGADEQYYCRCPDRKEKPKNISLSRTDSDDKSEPVGPELVAFVKETLNKNARDRSTLLKIEKELHSFINDPGRCIVKFPVMTSYGRMLVHRCAALFQLAHHIDQANKTCVIVSKSGTSGGRVPCTSFKSWCVASLPPSPRHAPDHHSAKSILKRDTHSLDEPTSGANAMSRSKSLEQREREYERVRRRIFSSDESQWPWLNAGAPVKLLTPEPGRNKLLKVQSLESPPASGVSWRSGGAVSKSHSFGGYGDQPAPRALSRQGDLASSSWRLSPSSSGYKTLSLRSTDSVTPSPTGGGTPEPGGAAPAGGALVWAVTDLAAVPRGVVLIHPQTGRPLTNPDGSVYHFDPANPPLLYDADERDKIDQNNDKRRGRLEKQDSFMDNDTECQSSEDCRNKCCCEFRKQDQQAQHLQQMQQHLQQTQQHLQQTQQHLQQTESPPQTIDNNTDKEISKPPPSPKKTYETNPIQNHTPESTNHIKPEPTNQKSPEQPDSTNQGYNGQTATNRSYEPTNQRGSAKLTNQDMVHYNPAYAQTYRAEEQVTSPQINPYLHQELSHVPQTIPQAKVLPFNDPNIRPVSLSNVMYPAAMPQAYPTYVPNHRMDAMPQQMFQPMLQQMEEPKQISTSPQDHTFRIDPSYPYPAVDYACCDPAQMQHAPPQRSYSVPYGQVEVGGVPTLLPPAYPAGGVLLPPPVQYPVQYQEPVQWTQVQNPVAPKLFDMCPVVYPHHYTHYNVLYPQVLPQAYPLCPPLFPAADKAEPAHYARKRHSLPSDERTDEDVHRQDSTEITAKIQQIKEQMSNLKTRGGGAETRREGEWRRNSGHGILGTCPAHYQPGRANDDTQLNSAARAILNSLRNMQAKNTYQQDRRTYTQQQYGRHYRAEYRGRRERDGDKPGDRHQGNNPGERQELNGKGDGERKFEPRGRLNQLNLYRPPYLFRQMSPGTWCRRSPAPVHPTMNQPRRPHPDTRPRR